MSEGRVKGMTERYYRKTAAIVGALFIVATAASLATAPLLGSALDGPDYLLGLPDVENDIMMAAVFETILATSLIGIGALMFPVLRKHVEGLGIAYAGIRLVEAIFIVVGAVCLLGMLSMGQDYAAGRLDEVGSQSMGALLLSLREGSLLFGTLIFLSLGGLALNYVLYRSRLVPRWLSAWGLVGDVGILIYGTMGLFGTDTSSFDATTLLAAPIAVQEMVFASWLIVKGFDTPTNATVVGS
ncbi:MAG TPA: DUF4386 domain-containing protein [Thermoplasmata archaeon]|jgi:hypothetical protein